MLVVIFIGKPQLGCRAEKVPGAKIVDGWKRVYLQTFIKLSLEKFTNKHFPYKWRELLAIHDKIVHGHINRETLPESQKN